MVEQLVIKRSKLFTNRPPSENRMCVTEIFTFGQLFAFWFQFFIFVLREPYVKFSKWLNSSPQIAPKYLKKENCLRDKFSQYSRIFFQICEIKSSRKIQQQPIHEIKSTRKKTFFRFSELAKLTFLHQFLHQPTMLMSKIFYRISTNINKDNIER